MALSKLYYPRRPSTVVVVTSQTTNAKVVSSILDKMRSLIMASVAESVEREYNKYKSQPLVDEV